MRKRVLVVEPDEALRERIRVAVSKVAVVDGVSSAPAARAHLFSKQSDWLVTNVRLQAYNGLHLAYLATSARLPLRILVYCERQDLSLAREAQRLGAFFESSDHVSLALAAYLRGTLPPYDRRDPGVLDRRVLFRGGRRCADSALVLQ